MPELPEVEGARRLVERNCLGKKIAVAVVEEDDSESGGCTSKHPWPA
jgi:formamidopyrimidine-DNA glycosylase